MNTDCQWSKQEACMTRAARCGSMSIITTVPHLANAFDVRSELQGQVSLAAVNQICVVHEATNVLQKSKNQKACFENVNKKK